MSRPVSLDPDTFRAIPGRLLPFLNCRATPMVAREKLDYVAHTVYVHLHRRYTLPNFRVMK